MPGHFQFGYFALLLVQPTGTPSDLIAAVVAAWNADPVLTTVSPQLYFDEVPDEVWNQTAQNPYCVLSLTTRNDDARNTGKGYREMSLLKFAVYASDQDLAVNLGGTMQAVLDTYQANKLTFANGYQMGWFHANESVAKVEGPPGRGKRGAFIYRCAHTYLVHVGRART